MTNGVYACETWNYTTNDIARIERHYFRLLRDVLLMSRLALPASTFISVMDYAVQQGKYEIFPMECLIQRQQLKFLWKIAHLEDTAIQKIVLFGKISSQFNGRKGGRKQTYVSCLRLALANFGVTMEECMEMTELDWEFRINNQALLEATEKWKARPSALKLIDNFWAPGMQVRGKRKRIIANEDEEDGGTEEDLLLSSDAANRTIIGANSSAEDRATEKADGEIPAIINYRRGRRQQSFKRLRTAKPMHRVCAEQSRQDYSATKNNVTDEETANHQRNAENMEKQSDLARKANQCANKYAADVFIARLEERFNIDGAAQFSGMEVLEQSTDTANVVEKIAAEINRSKDRRHEKNVAQHLRQRTAKKNKKKDLLSKSLGDIFLEPLQLIMGREKNSIQDDTNSHGQHIVWAHRTILGHTTRSAQ